MSRLTFPFPRQIPLLVWYHRLVPRVPVHRYFRRCSDSNNLVVSEDQIHEPHLGGSVFTSMFLLSQL
jgi:hypothetical protein